MIEILVLGVIVLGLGMWTKRQNGKHMYQMRRLIGGRSANQPKRHPIGPSNKYLK